MSKELMIAAQNSIWYNAYGGDENPEKAFAFIRDCGFDAVDFNLAAHIRAGEVRQGNVHGFFDASLEELLEYYRPIKAAADKCGVAFAQAHGPYPLHVEEYPHVHEYLLTVVEKMLGICQMLECPYLVVHPIIVRNRREEWERNMEMYRKLMPTAKKYGVTICLENLFTMDNTRITGRACSNMDDACRYIDELNAQAGQTVFGFCYDVGHAILTSNDIYEDIKQLGHRLVALHIHENNTQTDMHQIPYMARQSHKELNTNWEEFAQALREIGYRGSLNLESHGSLRRIPTELLKPMLQCGAAICDYFKKRILE